MMGEFAEGGASLFARCSPASAMNGRFQELFTEEIAREYL
jgi:hypothetical protein